MKIKIIALVFFACFALLLIGGQVRSRSMVMDIPFSQVLFGATAFMLTRKKILKGRIGFVLMPLSIMFWDLFAYCFDNLFSNDHDWRFFRIGSVHMWLCMIGSLYGSFLASFSKRLRGVGAGFLLLSTLFTPWYMVAGYDYWAHYCFSGNFTGRTSGEIIRDWKFVVNTPEDISISQDKYVVLDFWSVSCAACFRKFPVLDTIAKQYKDEDRVVIRSVNLPLPNDSVKYDRVKMMGEKYTFQNLFADSSAWKVFGIVGVPTVVVMKNDEMVFKGNIENLQGFLVEELR